MTTLANRLRQLRSTIAKMSQIDFSAKIGIPQTTWGRYERGENAPDAETLARLCEEFEVLPAWLLLGQGPAQNGSNSQHLEKPRDENVPRAPDDRIAALEAENKELAKKLQISQEEALKAYKLLIHNMAPGTEIAQPSLQSPQTTSAPPSIPQERTRAKK